MYKILLAVFISIFLGGCSSEKEHEITETAKIEMRKDADSFMSDLRDVLLSEIQNNGLVAAVSVCSDTAQKMTNNFGVEKGIFVKRVSINYRNENNIPDAFETEGLKYFEQMQLKGKVDSLTEYIKLVKENGTSYIRYLKPIFIQAPCLNCHGAEEQIIPEVREIISTRYKTDKAINYQIGDLRGAVSIQKIF